MPININSEDIFFYQSSLASCTWKLNRPSKPEDFSFTQVVFIQSLVHELVIYGLRSAVIIQSSPIHCAVHLPK